MTVALFTHDACIAHDPGPYHPESPARLRAVHRALAAPRFTALARAEAPIAPIDAIAAVHDRAYIDAVLAASPPEGRSVTLDADTHLSHGSIEAALRAAGGAMEAVDAVMSGLATHAFVATRPPGHHAEPDRAMGFCLFNAVAVAALHARARWNLSRVAVLDFDVHHGNGTQAMFWADKDLFYGSTHQSPCYPGTGARSERGVALNIVNRPLPPGAASPQFRAAWEDIFTELAAFAPDLVIASAGFDAHTADPLAQLDLTEADFAWIATRLADVSNHRLVSVLEGGYDLDALAASVTAYLDALMKDDAGHAEIR